MKSIAVVISLVAAASAVAVAQAPAIKADQNVAAAQQLTDLEFRLNRLLADRDFTTYSTFLADDYVRISANGAMRTKAQVLQEFRASAPGSSEAVPEIRQIRVYGNTAVMTIHLTITDRSSGQPVTRESLLTKVFVLREGRWIMVSNQGTSIGQPRAGRAGAYIPMAWLAIASGRRLSGRT